MYTKNIKTILKRITICAIITSLAASGMTMSAAAKPIDNIRAKAISATVFPTKQELLQNNEEIDEAFQKSVQTFSAKSASAVLSKFDATSNSVFSPTSLYFALAMLSETAAGNTQTEIVKGLGMNSMEQIASETPKLFRRQYFNNDFGQLKNANSLWMNNKITFKSSLIDKLAKNYYAQTFSVPFGSSLTGKKIGNWISDNTGGLLGSNTEELTPDEDGLISLLNTIYFKNEWSSEFDAADTKTDKFTLADKSTVDREFMNKIITNSSYVKQENYTMSQVRMKNGSYMMFILPENGLSTSDIIKNPNYLLEAMNLKWDNGLQNLDVTYKIPKFDFNSEIDLKAPLQKLGVKDVFNDKKANFSNLTDISAVLSSATQNVTIKIDEQGCEAAAYTKMDINVTSMPIPLEKADFFLDRPFVFAVVHDELPLFVGTVNQ